MDTNRISLGIYDRECLDKSWEWLNDPETRALTMTPEFTREDQLRFFEKLPRTDYLIWSLLLNNDELIGVAGLKNHRGQLAEYWCYIGEKKYWSMGLGRSLVQAVEAMAKKCGFVDLDIKVSIHNPRSIALHEKSGYVVLPATSTEVYLHMLKRNVG